MLQVITALVLACMISTMNVMADQIKAGIYEDSAGRKVKVSLDFEGVVLETAKRAGTKHYHMHFYPQMPTHHQILFVGGDGSYKLEDESLLKNSTQDQIFLHILDLITWKVEPV